MIKPLTSLRFVFAFMVFFHHLGFLGNSENIKISWFYKTFLYEGFIGVSFFFILSGFILSYVYNNKLVEKSISLKRFFVFRLARIYPLHTITLLLALPLSYNLFISSPSNWSLKLLEQITLTQSFIPIYDHYFSFNIVSWSISNEVFFYIMFPFLILSFNKFSLKKLIIGIVLIAILIFVLMNIVPSRNHHAIFYVNPLLRLFDFMLGIILYKIYKLDWSRYLKKATLFEIGSVLLLIIFYMLSHFVPKVYRFSIYYWLPISFLILVFSYQKGALSKILSNKVLVSLGEVSYGFYLIHYLVVNYSLSINKRLNLTENDIVFALGILTVSLIACYSLYYIIEKPANKFVKKIFLKKQSGIG